MKFKKSTMNVLEFDNGHILLGYNVEACEYHVLIPSDDRIAIFTPEEMEEVYGWDHEEMEFEVS